MNPLKNSEAMVLNREKRVNAGAKMAELLNKEDCDDFYKSTYGGFFDEEGDTIYESPNESESDYVDSDFDIEEERKSVGGNESEDEDYDEDQSKRRKSTKAYKEPAFRRQPISSRRIDDEEEKSKMNREPVSVVSKAQSSRAPSPPSEKQLRHSTLLKSEEYERLRAEKRIKHGRRKKYRRVSEYYEMPSQEELLKEAQETEAKNIKSLERFQQYELEKRKRHRFARQRLIKGPCIRFISMTMPAPLRSNASCSASLRQKDTRTTKPAVVSKNENQRASSGELHATRKFYVGDEQSNGSNNSDNTAESESHTRSSGQKPPESSRGKCARTFVQFSDDATFNRCFSGAKKLSVPKSQYCVVTGMPAKYLDPLTNLPYANVEAFKIIREAYCKHVEEHGDKNDPAVLNWLQFRRTVTA